MSLDSVINWGLLKEPLNWAIVGMMVFFIALVLHLLTGSALPSL